jgi:5'-3' exonuclease
MEVKVAVYDADFIPFYVCHNKKDASIKSLDDCINLCDDFIRNINKAINAELYCGYLTKGKCFRYQENPDYKANRKDAVFPDYSAEVRNHLETFHNFIGQEGYEADDLVLSFKKQRTDYDVIIVSPDKDILKLEGKHFYPREMKWITTTKQEAEEYFWKSMIIGDATDNIKGIPKSGVKAAEATIRWCDKYNEEYYKGVLEGYIQYFGEYKGIKEFTKNYLSLKIINDVDLREVVLNKANQIVGEEQENRNRREDKELL